MEDKLKECEDDMERIKGENELLKKELKSHLTVKKSTEEKLEQAQNKLGLTKCESQKFLDVIILYC